MATIGKNIKRARAKLGLTQDDLVRKSGVKYTTLTKIEGGFVQKPSVQVIAKIAKTLGVSIEELIKSSTRRQAAALAQTLSGMSFDSSLRSSLRTLRLTRGQATALSVEV